jgi:hypothetical protein
MQPSSMRYCLDTGVGRRLWKICAVTRRAFRKWNESGVVLEHHYDHRLSGEPLTHDDLRFDGLKRL